MLAKRFLAIITCVFSATVLGCTFLPLKLIVMGASLFLILGLLTTFIKIPLRQTIAAAFLAAALAAGIFALDLYQIQGMQEKLAGEEHQVIGEISDVSSNSAGTMTCYRVALEALGGKELKFYHRFSVNIYTYSSNLAVGDRINANIAFFDEPLQYGYGKEERTLCSGYIDELSGTAPGSFSLHAWLHSFKTNMYNRIAYGRDATRGLLRSVCYGDKSDLEPSLYVSLRRIGLSHITSVSGFHLSFAVLLFNYLMILLGIGHRIRYLMDIFICIFFTVAVGMPLSCIRACVMIVLYSLAMALNLFSDSLTSLSVAAFLIVLVNLQSVRDVGFLLSVFATLGMILLQARIERFLFPARITSSYRINWLYRRFTGVFSCSAAASIATLPVTVLVFQTVNLIGPLANVILIFPLELIFAFGMGMSVLGWIPFLGEVLGFLSDILYIAIEWCAHFLGKLQFASFSNFDTIELALLGILVLIVAASVYFYVKYDKRCFWHFSAMFLCLTMVIRLFGYYNFENNDMVEIAFVDVGQGDCTVVSQGNDAVILDYGGSSEKRYNLINYLKKKNIFNIELLAFTHLHADHTNGLNTLEANCYIQRAVYPELETDSAGLMTKLDAINADVIAEGCSFSVLDEVNIVALTGALAEEASTGNENCICYRIEWGDVSVLITGDLAGSSELKVADSMKDVTVLKVSHHGSNYSSLYPFLKAVSPELAVISVGDNSYGLPGEQALNRLTSVVPAVYTTKEEGTVAFKTDGRVLERIYA